MPNPALTWEGVLGAIEQALTAAEEQAADRERAWDLAPAPQPFAEEEWRQRLERWHAGGPDWEELARAAERGTAGAAEEVRAAAEALRDWLARSEVVRLAGGRGRAE